MVNAGSTPAQATKANKMNPREKEPKFGDWINYQDWLFLKQFEEDQKIMLEKFWEEFWKRELHKDLTK